MKILDTAQNKYLDHMDTRQFPDCFRGKRQFEAWQAVESIAHTKPRAFPCRDCTNEYHSQMVREGRCIQIPVKGISRLFNRGT